MKRVTTCIVSAFIAFNIYSQSTLEDLNILYQNDFEDNTVGRYSQSDWLKDFPNSVVAQRLEYTDIAQDVSDLVNPTKTVQFNFPAGSVGPDEGGGQFWHHFANQEELYMSYDILFMPGFKFQLGGKIPGVTGGEFTGFQRPNGYDGFTTSIMFKQESQAVFYSYYADQSFQEGGTSFTWGGVDYPEGYFLPSQVQVPFGTNQACYMRPGEWHNLTFRIAMNTVPSEGNGNYDGILEAYFDGKLVTQVSHILWRETRNLAIDCMRVVTFFGGSGDSWRNPIDEWLRIDNIILYTFKEGLDVPRGNNLSPTNRSINYWRKMLNESASMPSDPSNLYSSNITKNSVTLNWTDNATNESGFEIYRSLSPLTGFTRVGTTTADVTQFSNIGLSPNTTYYYQVLALNGKGKSQPSNTISASTLPLQVPAAPSSLLSTGATKTSGTIKWSDNSNNEYGFDIYISTSETGTYTKTGTIPANVTEYTQTSLSPNTTYYFKVLAYNGDGPSSFSNTLPLTTLPLQFPTPPSELKTVNPDIQQIYLEWKDNSSDEIGFEIEKSESDAEHFKMISKTLQNQNSYTDKNIISPLNYYRVRAYNSDGYSGYSDTLLVQFEMGDIPEIPTHLNIISVGYDKTILKWKDNSLNETGFEIERHGPNDEKIINYFSVNANDSIFSDSRLEMNSDYVYYVRAFNNKGYSGYSNKAAIKTLKLDTPKSPANLVITETTQNSIAISWEDKSNNESAFYIKRTLASDTNSFTLIAIDPNTTKYKDENLSPGTNYIYSVFASNMAGNSGFSNKVIGFTLSVSEEKRIKDGLVAYYNFSYDPNMIVHDKSNYKQPLELYANNSEDIEWRGNNSIQLKSGASLKSGISASKITESLKKTNELSIECWIKPSEPEIFQTSSIISLTDPNDNIGFRLDQLYSEVDNKPVFSYSIKLKTSSTNESGFPEFNMNQNVDYINLLHIVYTKDSLCNEKLYLNGSLASENFRSGGLNTWSNDYVLCLGNSMNNMEAWPGIFYTVAFYNKALADSQIVKNYGAGPTDNLIVNQNEFNIEITPVPTHTVATIQIIPKQLQDVTEESLFRIVNIYGEKILEEKIFNPSEGYSRDINFTDYPRGVYILELISGDKFQSKKFIVN